VNAPLHGSGFAFTAAMLIAMLGCGEAPPSGKPPAAEEAAPSGGGVTITDDAGREVTVPAGVERVASVTAFAVEYLMALGHPPVLRPDIPEERVRPAEARSIPTVAVNHSVGPNIEQLVAAEPDLVISSPTYARHTETIEAATRAPVVVLRVGALSEVGPKAALIGRLIGQPDAGAALAEEMTRKVNAVQPPEGAEGPEVFAIFGSPQAYMAFLPRSYLGSMVEHLGGRMITTGSPASQVSTQFAPFSLEFMVQEDPDVILMVHHGPPEQGLAGLREKEIWQDLSAVEHGRAHRLSQWRFVMNPGPGAVEALQTLRQVLYPEDPADERGASASHE